MSTTSDTSSLQGFITFRLATLEDRQEIVSNIPGIYYGLDYLPHEYPGYFAKNNFVCFVALANSKIVAFSWCMLIDSGQGQLHGGLRIADEYRNYGILPALQTYVTSYMRDKHPASHRWIRHAMLETERTRRYIEAGLYQLSFIGSYHVVYKQLSEARNVSDIMDICKDIVGRFVTISSAQKALDLLKHPDVRKKFLRNDICTMHFEPYRLYLDNFEYEFDIAKTRMQCLYRGEVHKDTISQGFTIPSSIAFIRPFACPGGFNINVDFYGYSGEEFLYHLWNCLTNILSKIDIPEETLVYIEWSSSSLSLAEDIAKSLSEMLQWAKHPQYGQRVHKIYYTEIKNFVNRL